MRYVHTCGDPRGTNTSVLQVISAPEEPAVGFLDLPPELRNRIYKFVLVENDGLVAIDASWQPPALLQTCKQIRNEASPMAYFSSRFVFTIIKCDCSLRMAFQKHVDALGIVSKKSIKTRYALRGLNWDNLIVWCRHIWKRDVHGLDKTKDHGKLWTVAYGATKIAKHTEGSWESCKRQLEAFRFVAGRVDERWLK